MPLGRYPERIKAFQKWARGQVEAGKLTGSATPGSYKTGRSGRRRRRRRRKHAIQE